LRKVDLARLRAGRAHPHQAAQWLARAAYAFIPNRPDHSHSNLGWDDALDGFVGHPIRSDFKLGLRVSDLALVCLDGSGKAAAALALHGKREQDARAWLGKELSAHGLDAGLLDSTKLPYEIPPHPLASGAVYDAAGQADALRELAAWFTNANISIERVRAAAAQKFNASPVRCWPHHFDLATLIVVAGEAETGRSVGVGLSPGDQSYDEPYFYITPWPYPDKAKLPTLPGLGHWHTEGYTAAIARAERILAARDPQAETDAFLDSAVAASIKALS
jgi:hypothetical protein